MQQNKAQINNQDYRVRISRYIFYSRINWAIISHLL